jgi:sigma-B regulation protein RsbU (phosphoserine phosphatase)
MAVGASLPRYPEPENPLHVALRRQLEQRREVLAAAAAQVPEAKIACLLREVDSALKRFDKGTYGICEICHTSVEDERLLADPMVRVCLCEFSPQQREALEKDLELAARIQTRLLPRQDFHCDGWHVAYHYKPLSVVSGDYCDLITGPDDQLHVLVGDVAGKGVAASMLMSNLSAIFRALIPQGLPLAELMKRANRIFTESVLPNQFATLICGRALPDGRMEISSAGHVPALLVSGDEVQEVGSQGMPIGLFSGLEFATTSFMLEPGSSLVLFSDGISEACCEDEDYGYERIAAAVMQSAGLAPREVIAHCVHDLETFIGCEPVFDDQTLMVVQRKG